ncbi:MAG: diguanylate cyclase domain-containing protein, partial [Gammaproteobacteria bacterium]
MVEQKIRLAQLRLCFDTTPQAQVATVVNGTLLAIFLREVVPATTLATWFGAMLLLSGVRVLVWRRFVRLDDPGHALDRWDRLNLAGAVASGVLWGSASLMMFPASSIGHQVFLSFVLGGMAAGAVTTLSSRLSAAIAFIVLALMPLVFRFAFATHEFAAGMSFMLSLFMIMMMVAAARFSHNFARTQSESLRREEAELELAKIEYYDPLTGLPNRNLFNDHLERAIASASRHDHRIAVCYIDLDYFRELNEA